MTDPCQSNPTVCQDDESNPHPSAFQKLRSGITLRSPLFVVSDSFGHENEADNSKSSEDKTSATGSNVAPRSIGSFFSPMEKAKEGQKDVYPFMSTELNTGGHHLLSSLGSKKYCGRFCGPDRERRLGISKKTHVNQSKYTRL